MGKRKRKSNSRVRAVPKAQQARRPSACAFNRRWRRKTSTLPSSEAAPAELQSEEYDETLVAPDEGLDLLAGGEEDTATRQLTLVEMLAQQPEEAVLFHPCERCGKAIRGEASHCEECSEGLEAAEALSREEKAEHERRMSLVRKGVVVTVLVTLFGTYFWFNDPRKLLDGLLPGIFGPSQEVSAGKVAHAEALPTASVVVVPVATGVTATGTTGLLLGPSLSPQTPSALITPGTATQTIASARQDEAVLPDITSAPAAIASPAPSPANQEATATRVGGSQAEEILVVPSTTPTPAAAGSQPTPTGGRPAASTPANTRSPETAAPASSATSTRTRTPLPEPTRTSAPSPPTVAPTRTTTVAPTATRTTLPVLPTLTSVLPTITAALPTATVPLPTVPLPTVTVPLPTLSVVPTEVPLPEPTLPGVPTPDVPPAPTVTLPVPTEVVPTVAAPTVAVPTVPAPTLPAPTVPAAPTIVPTVTVAPPTVPVPTAEVPTAQVPTVQVTAQVPTVQVSAVPTDVPPVATPTILGGQQALPTVTLPVGLP